MATVSEIRGELSKARPEEWKAFIEKYETDSRTGVIKLVEGCKRQIKKAEIENERLENMLIYEKKYYDSCEYICGIDEAGRGPLAGPVVAGAVILPKGLKIPYLNDSKQLSEKREKSCMTSLWIRPWLSERVLCLRNASTKSIFCRLPTKLCVTR